MKRFSDENEKSEAASNLYKSESNPKILKTESPDKWFCIYLKVSCPYELFNSFVDF